MAGGPRRANAIWRAVRPRPATMRPRFTMIAPAPFGRVSGWRYSLISPVGRRIWCATYLREAVRASRRFASERITAVYAASDPDYRANRASRRPCRSDRSDGEGGRKSQFPPGGNRAVSSVGRASRLHREGRRFEPVTAHHSPRSGHSSFAFGSNRLVLFANMLHPGPRDRSIVARRPCSPRTIFHIGNHYG
jgi:hypothetical protein